MELVAVLDGDFSKGLQMYFEGNSIISYNIYKYTMKYIISYGIHFLCFTWKSRSSIALRIFSVLDGTLYSARYLK